jgi:molybdate transport system substrate-binding protein
VNRALAAVVTVFVIAVAACSSPASSSAPPSLTVFGAASLKAALQQAKTAYEAVNPGSTITLSTDSSAALAAQIEQGAPADVFLSADATNPRRLVDGGFAVGPAVVFAANKLCIVVPAGNPAAIASPEDLGKDGVKIIAAGDEVPITTYATQAVANLGLTDAYAANVVSREDNVKAVVAKIELGEGDAGIVYVTDAAASDKVDTVDIPDAANVVATYAGVVVKASNHQAAAKAFLDWFAGPDGQAILGELGFLPPVS